MKALSEIMSNMIILIVKSLEDDMSNLIVKISGLSELNFL